jgi:hypothetical protein
MTTRSFGFFGALLPLFAFHLLTLTPANAAPEIVWQVYNRFRFYKEPEVFRDYLTVAAPLQSVAKSDWILQTEQRLQTRHVGSIVNGQPAIQSNSWDGWASGEIKTASGATLIRDATCWDRKKFVFSSSGRCQDYILPASHQVMISVQDGGQDIPADSKCQWTIEAFHNGEFNQDRWNIFEERKAATPSTSDCAHVIVEVPYGKDNGSASAENNQAGANVSVKVIGSNQPVPPVTIKVVDLLVLGMGDSFGAGVGNPDKPTAIDQSPQKGLFGWDTPDKVLPARLGSANSEASVSSVDGASAQWLDQRCYRSQYGQQFRTALHLSVALPHQSVTYLDLACDGARIIEGLLYPKDLDSGYPDFQNIPGFSYPPFADPHDVLESDFDQRNIMPQPQLGYASYLLCRDRTKLKTVNYQIAFAKSARQCAAEKTSVGIKICEYDDPRYQRAAYLKSWHLNVCGSRDDLSRHVDLLFLSVGGNDIGFAPMVAYAVISNQGLFQTARAWLAKEVGMLHNGKIGAQRINLLWQKYEVLDDALCNYLGLCQTHKPVFLTAYPLPIDDGHGALCGTKANAVNATAAFDILPKTFTSYLPSSGENSAAIGRLEEIADTSCRLNLQRFAKFDGGPNAKDVIAQITANGALCHGSQSWADPGSSGKPIDWQFVGETQLAAKGHGFCASGTDDVLAMPSHPQSENSDRWTPPLDNIAPYKSRQRWFRTPNDAYVTTNWLGFRESLIDYKNFLTASTTSMMHPTAEGYAGMADALFGRVAKFLCSERAGDFGAEPLCQQPFSH